MARCCAIAAAAALVAVSGCAGRVATQAPEARAGEFPGPREIEKLAREPVRGELLRGNVRDVELWELAGPFPEAVHAAHFVDRGPWSALLSEVSERSEGRVLPTESMHCVARELGIFFLIQRAQPADALQHFITSRCGASVPRVRFAFVHDEVPDSVEERTLFADWHQPLSNALAAHTQGRSIAAGIWFGRRDGFAVAAVAAGIREVAVEPVSTLLGLDAAIILEGEVLTDAVEVGALVNRGRYGFADCELEPGYHLPRFRFACKTDPSDEMAWVSLSLKRSDHVLARPALELLVWPRAEPGRVYHRPSYLGPRPVSSRSRLNRDLLDAVNEVRRRAQLDPLEPEPAQSRTAQLVAPHFFAALLGHEPEAVADRVALGLMAGWSVQGTVQAGYFMYSWAARSADLDRLISPALEHPWGREALLSPDVERVAIGSVVSGERSSPSMGALFSTYRIFSARSQEQSAAQVLRLLEEVRAERGFSRPQRLEAVAPLASESAARVRKGRDPSDALADLVDRSNEAVKRDISGWMTEVWNLSELRFPEEYITQPELEVAVAASYRRERGQAWGRHVVMLIVAEPAEESL